MTAPPSIAIRDGDSTESDGALTQRAGRRRRLPLELVVFVLAASARLTVIFRDGGLRGVFGYDSAVYFAAADGLTRGRVPYRDFILLHPPGLMLALTPFAWLTRFVSDDAAFATAGIAFALLGSLNAVLVLRICRRLGWTRLPALAGALFYASWFGAVGSEFSTKLEPLGNFFVLCGLLAALNAQQRNSTRLSFVAGIAAGSTVCVKIWWIVPVTGLIVWHTMSSRDKRAGPVMLGGAAASALAINLPFFVLAPRRMFDSIIVDQLGRPRASVDLWGRLADLTQLPRLGAHLGHGVRVALLALTAALAVAVIVRAATVRRARPALALVGAQLVVLLAAPSWFPYYCDYLAIGLSLVVAAAASRSTSDRRGRRVLVASFPTVATAAVTIWVLVAGTVEVHPFLDTARLTRAVAHARCVLSDSPMALIEVDALSRGLSAGCNNWIDVNGPTYGRDRPRTGKARRSHNRRWQRDLTAYLRSGDAALIARRAQSGITAATLRAVCHDGVLVKTGQSTLCGVSR